MKCVTQYFPEYRLHTLKGRSCLRSPVGPLIGRQLGSKWDILSHCGSFSHQHGATMVPSPRGLLRLPDQSLLTETLGELGSPPCTGVCSSIRLECACVGGDGEHEGMKNVILRREQLTFGT